MTTAHGQGTSWAGPRRGFTVAEVALLAVVGLALLHHTDHVLRADHSGWPFKDELTPFTISLVVYPVALVVFRQRDRPRLRAGLMAALFVAIQAAHLVVETPADQYRVWATNMSSVDDTLGDPNLLDLESGALGFAAAGTSILLSVALVITTLLLIRDARGQERVHP